MICLGYLIYTIYKIIKIQISCLSQKQTQHHSKILLRLCLATTFNYFGFRFYYCWNSDSNRGICYWCAGALLIVLINGKLSLDFIKETSQKTAIVSTMIFTILIGASIFSLIFRGVGGDDLIDLVFGLSWWSIYSINFCFNFCFLAWFYFRFY